MAYSFENIEIIRENVIETFFAKAYDYVNSTPVPLRMSGTERTINIAFAS